MKMIINHSSMQPIYEQIADQIKEQVLRGEILAGEALPSVRTLAKDLKISALTVKKAYDYLEEEGLVVTVHGKGSFIAATNQNILEEAWRKEVEEALETVIKQGRKCGMSKEDLQEMFELLLEEREC